MSAQTSLSETDVYLETIGQIDNMLADVNAGLSPALQGFFSGCRVAANPSQLPNRRSMVSSGLTLADRFHALETRLDQLNDQVNGRIQDGISQINSLRRADRRSQSAHHRAEVPCGQPPTTCSTSGSFGVRVEQGRQVSTTTNSDKASTSSSAQVSNSSSGPRR